MFTNNPYAQAGWFNPQNPMAPMGNNWQSSEHLPPTFGTLPLKPSRDNVVVFKFVLAHDIQNCNVFGPGNQEYFQVRTRTNNTVVNRSNGGVLGEIAWRARPQIEVPGVIPRQLTGSFLPISADRQFRTMASSNRLYVWAPNSTGIHLYTQVSGRCVQYAQIRLAEGDTSIIYLEVANDAVRESGLLEACIFSTILLLCTVNID